MSGFGIVALLGSLVLLLVLNWGRFQEMGAARVLRLGIIWAVILTAGVLGLKLLGY